MSLTILPRLRPALVFQLATAAAAAFLLPLMARGIDGKAQALALTLAAAAVLFDLTISSVGVTWWTRRRWDFNARTVMGVLLFGLLIGGLTLPALPVRVLALSLLDPLLLGVAIWAVVKLRRGLGQMGGTVDPVGMVQTQLAEILPRPVAHFLTHEVLLWWSLKRGEAFVPAGATAVTSHLKAGRNVYIWLYIFMELPVNFALHMAMHGGPAWLLTLADTSVVLYLLAFLRSYERFTSFVLGDTFYLRQGMLWQAEIPVQHIEKVTTGFDAKARKLNLMVAPNCTLHLSQPVTLRGPWGITRSSDRLTLFVDDVKGLQEQLQR